MLLAAGLALLVIASQDSVRVQATLATDRIAAGGSTILTITVETQGEAPDDVPVPVLPPGLNLGPISDYSQLQVSFPGGRRRVTRREIALVASAPGVYRVPSVAVTVAGRRYLTTALQLVVGTGQGSDRVGSGATPPVRLRAWARPETAFVGEQVVYQMEAVFPEDLRLRQARAPSFAPPAATGFWTFDLPEPVTVSLRMVGADAVEVQDFRQVLFPLAEGTHVIPPAQLQYELRQGLANTPQVHTLATPPVTVNVRPLPPDPPPGFAGAVGSYRLEARLSSPRAVAGGPLTLRVTVIGSGNLKTLPRPDLPSLEGTSVYPGSEPTRMSFAQDRVTGSKAFEWTLVPSAPGRVVVPAISYSWFDPATRSYHTARTAELAFVVAPSAPGSGRDGGLRPIRTGSAGRGLGWALSPGFLLLQALPPVALLVGILVRRRRSHPAAPPGAAELDAAGLAPDPRACLEQVAAWLARQRAGPAVAELRDQVRHALYAPSPPTNADCEQLLQAARRLARRDGTVPSHAWPAALVVAAMLGPAAPVAERDFNQGVAAFQAADYRMAVRAFALHLEHSPGDHAAWYNLGNAWAALEQPGRATWAWLQALELAPRDHDARHNLGVLGSSEAARAFAPRVPVAPAEAALFAALVWWAGMGVGWLALTRRRRWQQGAFVTLAILLALALALLATHARRTERAIVLAPTTMRSAPARRAEVLRPLAAGAPLVLLERRGEWVLVRSYDLREGWLEHDQLGLLRSDPG